MIQLLANCLAQATIELTGMAPDCRATSFPFEMTIIVGIERIA